MVMVMMMMMMVMVMMMMMMMIQYIIIHLRNLYGMRSQWIQWDQGSASPGPDSKPSDGSASPTQCRAPTSPPARNTSHWGMLRGCLGNHPNLWLTLGDLHLGICFFLFIGYIPHMVVNISSDLRPDLLVVWSQVAEMSQAAARREPGRAASAPGLKKFWNRQLMAMIYVMGIV